MNRETLINTPLPRKLVWAHTPEMKISKKISKLSNLGQKVKSKIFKSHQKFELRISLPLAHLHLKS